MAICLLEQEFSVPAVRGGAAVFEHLRDSCAERLDGDAVPVRFVVTASDKNNYHCEVGVLSGVTDTEFVLPPSVFEFQKRAAENTARFNVVLLVPTGIGAEIGGHAGDAGPVARLLATGCDTLITHPNVVNASDINELPENGLYVEGSVICRFLMGTVGLSPVRANRVLVIIDSHTDELFVNAAVNSVNAARTAYGLNCPRVVRMESPVRLIARYASSGSAAGRVEGFSGLCRVLRDYRDEYEAVSISSVIDVPCEYHMAYFQAQGEMVNPWGGVEAILTHALSSIFDVPTAHAPMFESREVANADPGIVDPRMAAEAVSLTFLQSTLKGLHRSPRVVANPLAARESGVLCASDVSCVVIPDGCLGLPTLAALEQGIPVVAVRENRNVMQNNLQMLPWGRGQLHVVDNYWEAAGVLAALRAGLVPASVRRPVVRTVVDKIGAKPEITIADETTPVSKAHCSKRAASVHESWISPRVPSAQQHPTG